MQGRAGQAGQGRQGLIGGSALLYVPVETPRRKKMCFGSQDVGAWGISDLDLGTKSTQISVPPMSMSLSVHKTARQLAVVCHWRKPWTGTADHHRVQSNLHVSTQLSVHTLSRSSCWYCKLIGLNHRARLDGT
ncbi:hypothetical protein PspLS_00552 [Pyricularia sp. CBS 133598]|nr:hypothetical protein PspLS_00552 [Pyricularia sp. CBS 133598]